MCLTEATEPLEVTLLNQTTVYIGYSVHRLTPPILLTASMMATIGRFTLTGPQGGLVERSTVQNCRDYWYLDVLYIGNLYTPSQLVSGFSRFDYDG